MATIDDLQKSISEMDDDELIERLRELRLSRRTHKGPAKVAKAKPKKTLTLSTDQKKNLIAELEALMK